LKEAEMAVSEIDAHRAEEFGGRMVGVVDGAMLALSISVGHRLGLYDALAGLDPATSDEIAERTGLQERYLREWLAAQLAGGIVEHDPAAETWWLPREHTFVLTRAAGANNLGILAGGVARFGEVEDDVVKVFREGGGVPWSRLTRIQEWQPELSYAVFADIDEVLGLVPGLVDRLREGIDVLDVGCGTGHAAVRVADAYPSSRILGVDQGANQIAAASGEATRLRLTNTTFEVRDASDLAPASADLVLAFDVVHDLAHPYETLRAIHDALRPGGALLMAELALSSRPDENAGHPFAAALYTVSLFHCMTASLSEGGEGLGLAWGEDNIRAALATAGFTRVQKASLEGDPLNAYYVAHVD
jgi:2-polyprenyl-3-methyl-5-hydroxy-6-metoxy-1,4-benzoquinol methylase